MNEQVQNPTQQQEAPGVTLQDLAMAVRIIDLAVERGGFKGNEASTVGVCRDRIAAFLQSQQPAQDPNAPKDAPVPPSAAAQ